MKQKWADIEMLTAWRMESDDLARAKDVVQTILQDWDFMSWNVLLADDVVLERPQFLHSGGR